MPQNLSMALGLAEFIRQVGPTYQGEALLTIY
jgi:hypothetical protein